MRIELNRIAAEDFEPLLGQALETAGDTPALTLEAVERSPHPSGREGEGFSLILRGPSAAPLAQGIIGLEHPQHGLLELFMTPVGADASGLQYQIIFN